MILSMFSDSIISRGKLRTFLHDDSFIDVWFSLKISEFMEFVRSQLAKMDK